MKDPTPKRNLIRKWQIPPRREIWPKGPGSHPEGNLGWENRIKKKMKLTSAKKSWPWPKKVDLGFLGHDLKVVPPKQQQQQQQQQQLSPFYDLSASPPVKRPNRLLSALEQACRVLLPFLTAHLALPWDRTCKRNETQLKDIVFHDKELVMGGWLQKSPTFFVNKLQSKGGENVFERGKTSKQHFKARTE